MEDIVDPLLFFTAAEDLVIPNEEIKGVVSNITVVDNETVKYTKVILPAPGLVRDRAGRGAEWPGLSHFLWKKIIN